jgi:hypothetical protein
VQLNVPVLGATEAATVYYHHSLAGMCRFARWFGGRRWLRAHNNVIVGTGTWSALVDRKTWAARSQAQRTR